jgi:predicted secreted Zn-dependent protease
MPLVITPTTTTHYDVVAPTLEQVAALLKKRKEAGHCDWSFRPFEWEGASRNGPPRSVTLTLDIAIVLPRWADRDAATAAEQREWDRVYEALVAHEKEHERIALDGAPTMYDALTAAKIRDLASTFHVHRAKIDRAQKAFDDTTKHGLEPPPGTKIRIPPPA